MVDGLWLELADAIVTGHDIVVRGKRLDYNIRGSGNQLNVVTSG